MKTSAAKASLAPISIPINKMPLEPFEPGSPSNFSRHLVIHPLKTYFHQFVSVDKIKIKTKTITNQTNKNKKTQNKLRSRRLFFTKAMISSQKAVRLVKHDLPLVNASRISSYSTCLDEVSRRVFLSSEPRLTDLLFLQ